MRSQRQWMYLIKDLCIFPQPAMQETYFQSLGLEDPLEKGMATHSRVHA